jgi:hypothetical protein
MPRDRPPTLRCRRSETACSLTIPLETVRMDCRRVEVWAAWRRRAHASVDASALIFCAEGFVPSAHDHGSEYDEGNHAECNFIGRTKAFRGDSQRRASKFLRPLDFFHPQPPSRLLTMDGLRTRHRDDRTRGYSRRENSPALRSPQASGPEKYFPAYVYACGARPASVVATSAGMDLPEPRRA